MTENKEYKEQTPKLKLNLSYFVKKFSIVAILYYAV